MIRHRLRNGLRVVVDDHPTASRVAVSVHYGVGFRTEPPGREGFAHLFEHLMFRGSANLPRGAFWDHVYAHAGEAGGTTHQDYTEYFQVVPTDALEAALFAEADRMRAPVFTVVEIAGQLAGVAAEIRAATVHRPYGGLPWPLLPAALFTSHADAHDGYGDAALLDGVRPGDCREFFDEHYAPSNAVLAVVGRVAPERILDLVETHFGDIADRPATRADASEPPVTGDRWITGTEPGVTRSAIAVGAVLPDPARDLHGYLAHRVLADMIGPVLSVPGQPPVDAGCGFFDPLDARAPDTMVVAALLAEGRRPEEFVHRLATGLLELADHPGLDDPVRHVVHRLVAAHHRRRHDLADRCRLLARWEMLFDRAELLDDLPVALSAVTAPDVRRAATGLAHRPKGVVVLEPGPRRTRPAGAGRPAALRPGPIRAGHADTGAARFRRALPGPTALARSRVRVESTGIGEHGHLLTLPTSDPGLLGIRVRWPLSRRALAAPSRVPGVLAELDRRSRCRELIGALGGTVDLHVSGPWLDLVGDVRPAAVSGWMDAVARLLAATVDDGSVYGTASRTPVAPEPPEVGDLAWLAGLVGPDSRQAAPWTFGSLVARGSVTAFGGPCELAAAGELVRAAWGERGAEITSMPRPVATARPDRIVRVEQATASVHWLTLHQLRGPVPLDDPAAYLATGLLGGFPHSLLARRGTDAGFHAFGGRDHVLATSRSFVRAMVEPDRLDAATAEIVREIDRFRTDPPLRPGDVEGARRFCVAQSTSMLDSPARALDALCRAVAAGSGPEFVVDLPDRLGTVPTSAVMDAARELFGAGLLSVTLVGPPVPAEVADRLRERTDRAPGAVGLVTAGGRP